MRVMCNNTMINAPSMHITFASVKRPLQAIIHTNTETQRHTHTHTNNDTLGHNNACSSGNKEMSQLIFRLLL